MADGTIPTPESLTGLRRLASRLTQGLLEKALTAYFAATDEETPTWAKAVLASSLGYLILPADTVPDLVPVVGFTDDAAAIAAAIATVGAHVRGRHVRRARRALTHWGLGPS